MDVLADARRRPRRIDWQRRTNSSDQGATKNDSEESASGSQP